MDYEYINVYPIADPHIGSPEFNEPLYKRWIKTVLDDPYGYIVIAGDMLNNGLKNSKTNVYEETMPPEQQKDYLEHSLRPLAEREKVLCGTCGNHEYRTVREAGTDPLYDVFCRLGIREYYRQDGAFLKVNLGVRKQPRQCSYVLSAIHGAAKYRVEHWISHVDGVDVFITGHTHQPKVTPPSKIVVDAHNEKVILKPYKHVVCNPFTHYGGYAMRGMFLPSGSECFQVIRLSGTKKEVSVIT